MRNLLLVGIAVSALSASIAFAQTTTPPPTASPPAAGKRNSEGDGSQDHSAREAANSEVYRVLQAGGRKGPARQGAEKVSRGMQEPAQEEELRPRGAVE